MGRAGAFTTHEQGADPPGGDIAAHGHMDARGTRTHRHTTGAAHGHSAFGCAPPLLAQHREVLAKLPPVIRALRQVRREWDGQAPPESDRN